MVLHRPVELAGLIGMWEFGVNEGQKGTFRQSLVRHNVAIPTSVFRCCCSSVQAP
jgi:hypothetical protein